MNKVYILCLALLVQCIWLSSNSQAEETATYTVQGRHFVASTSKMDYYAAREFCIAQKLSLGDPNNLYSTLLRLSKQHEFDDFVWSSGLSQMDPGEAYAVHIGKREDGLDEAVTLLKHKDNKFYAFCG